MFGKLPPLKKDILPPLPVKDKHPIILESTLEQRQTYSDTWRKKLKHKVHKVFLKLSKDKNAFLEFFKDKIKNRACLASFIALGDAYMKIFESKKALECYESALRENPKEVISMIVYGDALIQTHHYSRAVGFLQESIRNTKDFNLKVLLAELYINLRQYQKAELMLLELQEGDEKTEEEITDLKNKIKLLSLLSRTQEKTENFSYSMKNLKDAIDIQKKLINNTRDGPDDIVEEERVLLAEMILNLGRIAISCNKREKAVKYYLDGLIEIPNNTKILLALAESYLQSDEMDLCQEISSLILAIEPNSEAASVNLIDVAIKQTDFYTAISYCKSFLLEQPQNWKVLIRIIELFRRTGSLNKSCEYLLSAKEHFNSSSLTAKLMYCEAMYQWYLGDQNSAIRLFHSIKDDSDIGLYSIYNMLEICLSVEDLVDSKDIEHSNQDSRGILLETAEYLLKELKIKLGPTADKVLRFRLLTNYRLILTKSKFNIERAMEDLSSLGPQEKLLDNVGVVLGLATALIILKEEKRAKNQLKFVAKSNWTADNAEYLERCWVLLGHHYIQSGKNEVAANLLWKVLQYNKSSAKAHEYLGYIFEKDQNFNEAAIQYNLAWELQRKRFPSVGLKLARCYMKIQKYPNAIIIAETLLELCPERYLVSNEILEKCIANLRI